MNLDDINTYIQQTMDAKPYARPYTHTATPSTFTFPTTQFGYRFTPDEPEEPAKLSDCPHKPGTIEHRDWIRVNVLDRQTDPRTDAYTQERERIGGLVSDRRVQMETDRARRAAELDAMIADLPEPGVDLPPRTALEIIGDKVGWEFEPWQTNVLHGINWDMDDAVKRIIQPYMEPHYPIVKYDLDSFTKITGVSPP